MGSRQGEPRQEATMPPGTLPLAQLQQLLGAPALTGSLLQGGFPSKLPPVQSWVLLPADAMLQSKLTAGEQVLLAITDQRSAQASSPQSRQPSSTFAPVNLPSLDPTTCQLLNLWTLGPSHLQPPSPQQGQGQGQGQAVGQYVFAATAWPMQKLPRSCLALSPSLMEVLSGVLAGSMVAVFPASSSSGMGQGGPCLRLSLRLCPSSLPSEYQQQLQEGAGAGAGAGAGDSAAPTPLPSPPSASLSKSSSVSSSRTPKQQSQQQQPQAVAGPRLLSSSDWLFRCLSGGDKQSVALMEQIVIQHLDGRTLLPGNPVALPLLGYTLVFSCQAASTAQTAGSRGPTGPGPHTLTPHPPGTVSLRTQLQLNFTEPEPATSSREGEEAGGGSHPGSEEEAARRAGLIARARTAAEQAVSSSASEAAATAAERAVSAGLSSSSQGFSSLGGVTDTAASLRQLVTLPLRAPQLFAAYKIRPPRGVLLWGPPGSGKTVLARAAAADAGATLLVVNGPDVVSEYYGESEAGLQGIFAAAQALAPSVIFIDEVDALAPSRGGQGVSGGMAQALAPGSGSGGGMSGRMLTVLLTLMDGFGSSEGDVVVVAATNRPEALDPALRRPGRFERELEVGVPSAQGRTEILRARLQSVRHCLGAAEVSALAAGAHGFVGADLAQLVDAAALGALRRVVAAGAAGGEALEVQLQDFQAAEARVRPSAMRQVAVEVPRVTWSDIGGLEEVKQRLQEVVEWPSRHPEALQRLGASAPKGVLLYGPPGCSKTLLARAVACEAGLNFISIKGGELFSMYVGESEKAIASLFSRARAVAPSLVFFDEIDALAASRSPDGETGSGERVLSQLLMEMDGLQARANVVVLAATNRPDCVDAALLRPGRFDRLVFVPPPDQGARGDIFRVQLRRTPTAADVDLSALAAATAQYTGADISAVCREAALSALEEDLGSDQVAMRHFMHALELVPPSAASSVSMERVYRQLSAPG